MADVFDQKAGASDTVLLHLGCRNYSSTAQGTNNASYRFSIHAPVISTVCASDEAVKQHLQTKPWGFKEPDRHIDSKHSSGLVAADLECLKGQAVGNGGSLLCSQASKEGHALQGLLVSSSLLHGGHHNDGSEGGSVHHPHHPTSLSLHSTCLPLGSFPQTAVSMQLCMLCYFALDVASVQPVVLSM